MDPVLRFCMDCVGIKKDQKNILARAGVGDFQNKGSESLERLIAWATQGDYVAEAAKAAGELYGYGHTNVLFKPTKAGVDLKGIITYRSGFHFLVRYPYITLYYPHVTLYNI